MWTLRTPSGDQGAALPGIAMGGLGQIDLLLPSDFRGGTSEEEILVLAVCDRRVMTDLIPQATLDVIRDSTFRRLGVYRWVRATRVGDPCRHLLVMRDDRETTVVTREADLEDLDVLEANPDRWELLAIDCANPFYCVGFVARISSALTAAGLDILFTSTFSRDWVFVKEADGERASEVLIAIGIERAADF